MALTLDEAAKVYADVLVYNTDTPILKLQHESTELDFKAGARWRETQFLIKLREIEKDMKDED